ncbi:hypothetical protein FG05_35121 [Fusarium graminearum]|nr:hypothetical protein FG05_35121 [Fusarium graminearum]
MTAHTY